MVSTNSIGLFVSSEPQLACHLALLGPAVLPEAQHRPGQGCRPADTAAWTGDFGHAAPTLARCPADILSLDWSLSLGLAGPARALGDAAGPVSRIGCTSARHVTTQTGPLRGPRIVLPWGSHPGPPAALMARTGCAIARRATYSASRRAVRVDGPRPAQLSCCPGALTQGHRQLSWLEPAAQ